MISDNGSEFRAKEFARELERLAVAQRRIPARRPIANGHVERLQLTVLEESWRPAKVETAGTLHHSARG